MIVKIANLGPRVQGIYKINYPNGKIYIGLSVDIKRRMSEHNTMSKAKMPCDLAIRRYGKITEIEILELVEDASKLAEREQYWIKYYQSNNKKIGYNLTEGGDGMGGFGEKNCKSVFTNQQVLDIRRRRFLGQERKKDVYKDYSQIPFATFERVWLGRGYPDIGQEYIIPPGTISRQTYSSNANDGLKNGRAKCTREQILEMRRLYGEEHKTQTQIAKMFPQFSKNTIRRIVLRETYKNVE